MKEDNYSFLDHPLETTEPQVLMQQITFAEAHSHEAMRKLSQLEHLRAELEEEKSVAWAKAIEEYKAMKVDVMKAKALGDIAGLNSEIEKVDSKITYYKTLVKVIDRRCSLGQSIIANITSQIKAGINL